MRNEAKQKASKNENKGKDEGANAEIISTEEWNPSYWLPKSTPGNPGFFPIRMCHPFQEEVYTPQVFPTGVPRHWDNSWFPSKELGGLEIHHDGFPSPPQTPYFSSLSLWRRDIDIPFVPAWLLCHIVVSANGFPWLEMKTRTH